MEDRFKFFKVSEFAEALNVQNDLIYKYIKEGKIRALRLNNGPKSQWRIPHSEMVRFHELAYLEEHDFVDS